jgi:antitoxin HicB
MRTVEEYLDLPYHVVIVRDEDEDGDVGYVAQVQELPGCISQGDTPEEAFESVRDAMYGWIKVALEDGKAIPEPAEEPTYSGRFMVRGPKTLHAALMRAAEQEGVSLNLFVVSALAASVDWPLHTVPVRETVAKRGMTERTVPLQSERIPG